MKTDQSSHPPPNSADQGQPPYHAGMPYYGAPYGTPYYGGAQPESSGFLGSLDPFRLIRVMRKKWITVLCVLIFAGIAATYYLLTTPRVYQAVSLVELSVRRPRIMTQQAAVIEDQGGGRSV